MHPFFQNPFCAGAIFGTESNGLAMLDKSDSNNEYHLTIQD